MLDVDISEILVIAVVALVAIGPKDLPAALRTAGVWARKAKLLAGEFQRGVDNVIKEAELDDIKREVQSVQEYNFKTSIEATIDPKGELNQALQIDSSVPVVEEKKETLPANPGT